VNRLPFRIGHMFDAHLAIALDHAEHKRFA
jgi:hypothetical protein